MIPAGEPDAEAKPAPGPDHLGRHRRGPRPARARGRARVPGRGSRRPGLDRQRAARDGADPDQGRCARTRRSCSAGCRGCSTSSTGCSCTSRRRGGSPKRLLTAFGRRGLMRLIRAHDPDLIVSTYPGVTAVLGELRRTGRLKVPCYSSITDLAGLHFWAHPGIDLHFVTHPESIEEVEQIAGPGSVRWAKPPTSPAFLAARSRADARRALGLPADGQGDRGLRRRLGRRRPARRDRAPRSQVPDAIVLCLCGRNDKLRARVAQALRRRAAAAADGLHRPDGRRARRQRRADPLERRADRARGDHPRLPGDLLRLRLRPRPRLATARSSASGSRRSRAREAELGPALERALEQRPEPDGSFARRPSTASLILTDERRARHAARAGGCGPRAPPPPAAATVAIVGWALTDRRLLQPRLALRAHAPGDRRSRPTRPEVGVLVDAPSAQTARRSPSVLSAQRDPRLVRARPPAVGAELRVLGYGDQAIPRLPDGRLVRWLGTRDQLTTPARRDGLRPPLPVRVERAERRPVVARARRRRAAGRGRRPARRRRRLARAACTPARWSS